MKMESRVPSPRAATITQVLTHPGAQVEPGTPLLILTPHPS